MLKKALDLLNIDNPAEALIFALIYAFLFIGLTVGLFAFSIINFILYLVGHQYRIPSYVKKDVDMDDDSLYNYDVNDKK